MSDPVADQIAAHERYLRLAEELAESEGAHDAARTRALRREVAAARRRWHQLVRAAEAAQRTRRPGR